MEDAPSLTKESIGAQARSYIGQATRRVGHPIAERFSLTVDGANQRQQNDAC
jgi:hypothetical protein